MWSYGLTCISPAWASDTAAPAPHLRDIPSRHLPAGGNCATTWYHTWGEDTCAVSLFAPFHHSASANTLCLIFNSRFFFYSVPDGLLSANSLEFYGFLSVVSPTSDISCILELVGDSLFLPTSSQIKGSCRFLPIQAWSARKLSLLLPHPQISALFPQTESLSASCWASHHPRELPVEVWVKTGNHMEIPVVPAFQEFHALMPNTLRLYTSDLFHWCSHNWWLSLWLLAARPRMTVALGPSSPNRLVTLWILVN